MAGTQPHDDGWIAEEGFARAQELIRNAQKTKAVELDLSELGLVSLPREIGELRSLVYLDVQGNRLITLPAEIGLLDKLEGLWAHSNRLVSLPREIGNLQHLKTLNLNENELGTVPKEIGDLTSLAVLNLAGNGLKTVPKQLGRLRSLMQLSLQDNDLNSIPKELSELRGLRFLFLHGNASLGLPPEVLGPTRKECQGLGGTKLPAAPADLLAYYYRVKGDAGRALGEFKLIVVGRGGAGKTSLIKRLQGKKYDPNEPETHGIRIQSLQFACEDPADAVGRVWDFGGQVVLHSMHEFFLTARSLYVLVLGERDDMVERDAAYWLQLIRSYAGDAPVVVVLNKSAGRQRQFDRASLERLYGPILGWVATECSEAEAGKGGILELRRTIARAIDGPHMESVRTKFPVKWFDIKTALENMPQSYLEYETYVKRCEEHGEHDAAEQAALAAHLHDLGVALNYGRDPRLRNTTVLRPDWLANGIYAVLRANDLDAKLPERLNCVLAPGGIVTAELMESIHAKAQAWSMLRASDYPPNKRRFLLRLMDMFHLSYPLDGGPEQGEEQLRHLVPSLLPLEPLAGAEEPEDAERVRVRYVFHVVPAPLLPWFIARTYSLIPGMRHWRRGTMLMYGEASGRVWTTQEERYVFVTVAGPTEDRDNLLAMIRGTFAELFRGYKGLKVTEQWEHSGEWVPRKTLEKFGALPREDGDDGEARAGAVEVEKGVVP